MAEFLDMGGYAAFVWPALLLTAAVMAGLFAVSLADLRAQQRLVARLENGAGPRPRRPAAPAGDLQAR